MPNIMASLRPMIACVAAIVVMTPAAAEATTPRELLIAAAFQTSDKSKALALIGQAITESNRALAARANDREAMLQRGIAIGYRAKLTRNRTDAATALRVFQSLAASDPRDPEAQMAIAGWHLDAIDQLGGFIARTMIGAKAQTGEAAMARAIALGGQRALFPAVAALMRIRSDPGAVGKARALAEAAAAGQAPTPLDALMKRNASALLPALRANDGKAASALARKLLPFGRLAN